MGSFFKASVERLESRVLMAVDVTVSERGRLLIRAPEGDAAGDTIEVTLLNGRRNIQVFVNGELRDLRRRGGEQTTVRRNRIRRITAELGAGDDKFFFGHRESEERQFRTRLTVRCSLNGGDGNDVLEGGPLDDLIVGGAGDDFIIGGRGDDDLFAGSGNDSVFGETGRDNLFGQDGDDTLDGGGNEDALYGMLGADVLTGGDDEDFLNPAPGPGDSVTDGNEKPEAGETEAVTAYVDKLIELGVPERFRRDARS